MNVLFLFIYILHITHSTDLDVVYEFFQVTVAIPIPFHHEVSFFPPWWKETYLMEERKLLHGGKI